MYYFPFSKCLKAKRRTPPAALLLFENHISGWISLAVPVYCLSSLIELKVLVFLKLCVSSIFQQTRCKTLQICSVALKISLLFPLSHNNHLHRKQKTGVLWFLVLVTGRENWNTDDLLLLLVFPRWHSHLSELLKHIL